MYLKYVYLFCCFVLFIFWLIIFFLRKDLRKEMLWASIVGLPFGLIDYFLIPGYWHPDVVFDLGIKHGFGLESFLFFSLMAGITSVIYEFVEKKKLVKIKGNKHHHFLILIFAVIFFIILGIIFPNYVIYNLIITLFVGGITLIFLRKDLLRKIVMSGFIFAVFYFVIFIIINKFFSNFVPSFFNVSSISIVGIPIEELLAAFTGGMFWSVLYEYVNAFREDSFKIR